MMRDFLDKAEQKQKRRVELEVKLADRSVEFNRRLRIMGEG